MGPYRRNFRLIGATVVLLVVAASLWAGSPAFSARPPGGGAAQAGATQAKTATDAARQRISPTIRDKSGKVDIVILHNISAKADLLKISPNLRTRAYVLTDGSTVSFGSVDASLLVKLAAVGGVTWVGGARDGQPALAPPDSRDPVSVPNQKPKHSNTRPAPAVRSDGYSTKSNGPTQAEDWFDVDVEHNAREAWQNGYDGAGVVVSVNDSGVDFGHPDLQGTFARIQGGPYAGWPLAFDNYGTAYWENFGLAQTVDLWNQNFISYYVDTSATLSAPAGQTTSHDITVPIFDHFSDPVTHSYIMPTTSKSGVVHVGFHPDASLGWGWTADGGQPAIVVVDEHTAGVYDTVYVDLDDDHDFRNDMPQSKNEPVAALDWDGDGVADQSGGMLYWIADGAHANPGGYIWSNDPLVAGAGDLVGFMFTNDIDPNIGSAHGLLCASMVIAQGVASNGPDQFGNPPPAYKPAGEGMLWGTANKAKLAALTVYTLYDFGLTPNLYGALGPDGIPQSGDEVNVSSNSYGSSDIDNDGWDEAAREYATYNYNLDPNLTFVMSTGNGAPGYGTDSTPGSSNTVIGVGASTSYGSVSGYDAISSTEQINWGNVASFSGRGPTGNGRWGPSVLANGNFGTGAVPLNQVGSGESAYETWSGTSRSTPLTAGIVALVYDAYKTAHGHYPTYSEARHIVMSTANDTGHDAFSQGAGVVDALRATNASAEIDGVVADPSAWQPGSFDGVTYSQDQNFANVMAAGSSASGVISVTNSSSTAAMSASLSATTLQVSQVLTYYLSTNSGAESPFFTGRPDYLVHLFRPEDIPANAVLMTEQLVFPYEQFNPALNYSINDANSFRIHAYDWTDLNGDGKLWNDLNGNGAVNPGELDALEYNRMNYGYNTTNAQELTVGQPRQRIHDGLYLGVQHDVRNPAVPSTNITIRITFYKEVPWNWLTLGAASANIAAGGTYALNATVNVPANTRPGLYEGFIKVKPNGGVADRGVAVEGTTQIPVTVVVAAQSASFNFGGQGRQATRYDNNVLNGDMSWGWRQESGDWRYFFADVPEAEAGPGKFWLVNTNWTNYALPNGTIPTDIDTYLYGPTASHYSDADPANFGPYSLEKKGGSTVTYQGNGIWRFQTATGGTEEWVSGSLSGGLNEVMVRTTEFNGRQVNEQFSGKSGVLSVNPYPIVVTQTCGTSISVDLSSTLALPDFAVKASGLSQPITMTETVTQNQYTDYSFTLTNPALLDVRTIAGGPTPAQDVDLEVYRIVDGARVLVGASAGGTANEQVTQNLPAAGEYLVRMFGYTVTPSPGTVILALNNIDGDDLALIDAPTSLPANRTATLHLQTGSDLAPGTYNGAIVLGPAAAPGAAFIPVTVVVSGECPTATETPTVTATPTATGTPVLPFSDVHDGDYFFQSVNWLYQHGAISGYADGTFKPYNTATRAQLVKIVVVASGLPIVTPATATFSDVPTTSGYFPYVETAAANGIVNGYNDDNFCGALPNPCFKPDNDVTRAQIAKIVTVAAGWELLNPATPYFADVPTSDPFYQYIETAHAHYVISGYDCGTPEPCPGSYYRPGAKATRGQIAKIVYLSVNTPVVNENK